MADRSALGTLSAVVGGGPQATRSDADLARQGALALALAHGDKPRYGGKFLSVGNEEVPFYDMHQTSLGGIYAAVAPAYNCLIRTSPYDPKGQEIIPELADTWEISDGGKTLTFHLHKGVKWHDGTPFSSADVKYTIERIMRPPEGMVSPRGPVFNALIERVEAPDPDTVVVYGKGPTSAPAPPLCQRAQHDHSQAHRRKGPGERPEDQGDWHRAVPSQRTAHHVAVEV